jgi:mannitol-specific phosphotransferase system IIBC component
MKLVLKIAAGIIVAWVVILVSGVVLSLLAANAIFQTSTKPQLDKLQTISNKIQSTQTQQTQRPVGSITYTNKLPYTNQVQCNGNGGIWGFDMSTDTPFDLICVSK